MFKSLKDKLKNALGKLTSGAKSAEKEAKEPAPKKEAAKPKEEPKPVEKKRAEPAKSVPKESKKPEAPKEPEKIIEEPTPTAPEEPEEAVKEPKPEPSEEPEPEKEKRKEEPVPAEEPEPVAPARTEEKEEKAEPEQEKPKKGGLFGRLTEKLTTVQLSEERFEELFWELELALLENNVALEVIEKIKSDLRDELTTGRTARGGVAERVQRRLRESLREVLEQPPFDLLDTTEKPVVIAAVGVNGSGKTTTLAKLGKYFEDHGKSVVLAACDTFRAAAIHQLEEHAKNLELPIIKQDYGADPAAVAYDAVHHAKAKGIDVVLIDTAGRLHSNTNLMDELKKVIRVSKPQHVLFVGEAVTGNDCVEQARTFAHELPVDGIILTKADVDEKGGAAVSVSYVTKLPIVLIGTGQSYEDLRPFDPEEVLDGLVPA